VRYKFTEDIFKSPEEAQMLIRAALDPANPDKVNAIANMRVAGMSGQEVIKGLGAVLNNNFVDNELVDNLAAGLGYASKAKGATPKKLIKRYVEFMGAWGRNAENLVRGRAYIDLLNKGFSPESAARQVLDAFVDYDVVSEANRTLRDLFPFIQFTIGTAKSIGKAAIERPGTVSMFGPMFRPAKVGQVLPQYLAEGAHYQVGTDPEGNPKVVSGFGTPIEALNFAGPASLASPFRSAWRTLGGLHPFLKVPLEMAAGKSTYFGTKIGEFAPREHVVSKIPGLNKAFLGLGLIQERTIKSTGAKVYYFNPQASEILSAIPHSRITGFLQDLFDTRKDWSDRILEKATGGVKIRSVNERREIESLLIARLRELAAQGRVKEFVNFWNPKGTEVDEETMKALQAFADTRELAAPAKGSPKKKKKNALTLTPLRLQF
jgi:hypothetical protein